MDKTAVQDETKVPDAPLEFLRMPRLKTMLGAGHSTIYRWINEGTFPRPYHVGPRNVAWRSDEVQEWIKSRQRVEGLGPQT